MRDTKGFDPIKPLEYSAAYRCIMLCLTEDLYYNTGHLHKSRSKLLTAHRKPKARKSYYKHKSDSDSSRDNSSDTSGDESVAKEPESESESEGEAPVRAATVPKKVVTHHKAPVIPTIRNVADQVGELSCSFDEMKIHLARSIPNEIPQPNIHQNSQQGSSPATFPNSYPLGPPQSQYLNRSTEGSANNALCWFCDKTGSHYVGMKNCPDAQAMIKQNMIKYSIEGQLTKMDGSRLPRGIPGKGGIKQAIIDEIKRFGSDIPNTSRSGACSLEDGNGFSPFQGRSYAIEADYRAYPAAKEDKANVRYTPMVDRPKGHKVSQLPDHKVTVEIPPRNLAKPNTENCPSHPTVPANVPKVNPVPEKKEVAENTPAQPMDTPFLNARNQEPGVLPSETLKQPPSIQVPQQIIEVKETAPPKSWRNNLPQEDIEMGFDAPEKKIPKPPPAFRFTTDFQDACEDKDVADRVLKQMIEISIGDFLGTAIGPAKILAAGLKLKEPTMKYCEPLTVNKTNATAYEHNEQIVQQPEDNPSTEGLEEEEPYKYVHQPNNPHPLKWLYKAHVIKPK